ncbi:MAG TPA: mannose-1-phosphate guanylyltransferase/mannose-6-phosphate isomerase, partial [Accumulibacter sp.]|nr:mannose-1-phosphate guanylyltransferase/mannose-6-phosphate isomerase [Accumulibacter sp.]
PKPFIRLADGQSLLQKAFLRAALLPDVSEILTVTNRELFFKTEDDFREINSTNLPTSFILEPFGRNTAAAIAMATWQVAEAHGEDAQLLILPADHLIHDLAAFAEAVAEARELALAGQLVTFGIQPETPETGYGYIEADGHRVVKFVEKPSLDKAIAYLESGRYLWNSGMFCFVAGRMLREMEILCPEILHTTQSCFEKSRAAAGRGFAHIELDPKTFALVPSNSIDYAVLERSAHVAVIPCNIGWSDIGSWTALGDLSAPNADGNRVDGHALLHDVRNCFIQSRERIVGAVGVEDLVVIDTPDAILIADKNRAQDVKHLYSQLKTQGHEAYRLHRTVNRPWGTYTVLEEGPRFKIKRIAVKPGASLSLQMHHHRSEHWIVVSGMAKVVNGENEIFVSTNQSTYIEAGHRHRLENPGVIDLVMIEVQSGEYLGEDDIVRFEDVYGRC